MNHIYKIMILNLVLLLMVTACQGAPQAAAPTPPQSNSSSNGLPTLDPSKLPTAGPAPTSTAYPTPTRAATITPFVTATTQPTQELPLDVTINFTNLYLNDLNVYCEGPYILQYTLKSGERRTVHIPAGTYTCRVSGLQSSNDIIKELVFPPGDVFNWSFINK